MLWHCRLQVLEFFAQAKLHPTPELSRLVTIQASNDSTPDMMQVDGAPILPAAEQAPSTVPNALVYPSVDYPDGERTAHALQLLWKYNFSCCHVQPKSAKNDSLRG